MFLPILIGRLRPYILARNYRLLAKVKETACKIIEKKTETGIYIYAYGKKAKEESAENLILYSLKKATKYK